MFLLDRFLGRSKLGRKGVITLLVLGVGCNIIGFVFDGFLPSISALPDAFYITGFAVWGLAVLLLRSYYFLTIAAVCVAAGLPFVGSIPKSLSFVGAGLLVAFAIFCGWRGASWEKPKDVSS